MNIKYLFLKGHYKNNTYFLSLIVSLSNKVLSTIITFKARLFVAQNQSAYESRASTQAQYSSGL